MGSFGVEHLHNFSAKTEKEKEEWWVGRLVRVRLTTNTMYINFPSENDIGIVIKYQKTTIGGHIKIYFSVVEKSSWIMTSDVYSYGDKK